MSNKLINNIPVGATHYLPGKKGEACMYYKVVSVKYNDGTTGKGLAYYSYNFETWRGSDERDREDFIKNRLVKLENI